MSPEVQGFLDLLMVLGIIGTVIGIVTGLVAAFIKVGIQLAPYLIILGLILLFVQYI